MRKETNRVPPPHERPDSGGSSRFSDGFRILQGKQEYVTYIDHSSIRVWPSDVAGVFETHVHSAVEIILPHRGTSVYQLPDREYRVRPGEILIVPPAVPHHLTESSDILRYLILFEPNPLLSLQDMPAVSAMAQQPVYLREQDELTDQVSDLLQQLVNCYFRRENMWNTECYSYLLQMYALLGRRYLREAAPAAPVRRRSIDPEMMNSAMTYIGEHFMNDLTLEEVAAFAGFSKYYFSRVFKEFAGLSFSDYLMEKRLNAASNLLIHTDRAVREIVKDTGFGSVATFNRTFREHKHCSPTQFRAIYGVAMQNRGKHYLLFLPSKKE